ncbi:hypothetical protein BHM03_00048943, partial [Ensete ventricosum]
TNGDISYLPWAREDLGLIAGAHPKKKHPRPRKASITLIQIAAGLPSPAENGAGRLLVPLLPPPAGSACRSDEWRGSRPLAELWMLMGAQKSIHAGKGTALYFCKSLCFTPKFAYLCLCCCVYSTRLSIKHPNLFGRNEKLEVLWNKGLDDSNILIAFRRPRPDWTSQQSFTIQVDVSCFKPFGVLNMIF